MLSFGHTSPPDHIKLRVALTSLDLATAVLYPAFNRFAGTSILGSTSELHELVATGVTVAGEALQGLWQGPLYTAEVNPRIRFCACTECGGSAATRSPSTIEALKEMGCPACGNHDFRRRESRKAYRFTGATARPR